MYLITKYIFQRNLFGQGDTGIFPTTSNFFLQDFGNSRDPSAGLGLGWGTCLPYAPVATLPSPGSFWLTLVIFIGGIVATGLPADTIRHTTATADDHSPNASHLQATRLAAWRSG